MDNIKKRTMFALSCLLFIYTGTITSGMVSYTFFISAAIYCFAAMRT